MNCTKERPILMCGEMVRAILDGRKTQTRRIVKPQPIFSAAAGDSFEWRGGKALVKAGYGADYVHSNWTAVEQAMLKVCPYGQPGERLWVREAWECPFTEDDPGRGNEVIYRATPKFKYGGPWRPSIFMPRWASRITLEITAVRVERLQDISEEDAKAEGVPEEKYAVHYYCDEGDPNDQEDFGQHRCNWRFGYKMLWDSINGKKHPWSSNPWVWVVSFKPIGHYLEALRRAAQ